MIKEGYEMDLKFEREEKDKAVEELMRAHP